MEQGLSDRRGVNPGQTLAYRGAAGRARGMSPGGILAIRLSRCSRTVMSGGSTPSLPSGPEAFSPVTAHRWARLAGDSWSDYLATAQSAQCT
jgi:hypothetical protein